MTWSSIDRGPLGNPVRRRIRVVRLSEGISVGNPEPNQMADLVGPFYDTEGVAQVLGVPVAALPAMREHARLLGVETSNAIWLYPVFQFIDGQVDLNLLPLLRVFQQSPRWATAVWLCGSDEELDGLTPLEWLEAGRPPARVVRLARHTAHRWAM